MASPMRRARRSDVVGCGGRRYGDKNQIVLAANISVAPLGLWDIWTTVPGPAGDYAPLILTLAQKGVSDHNAFAQNLLPDRC